jgi:hypothetical protein
MRATLCGPPVADIVSGKIINHIYDLNQESETGPPMIATISGLQ